jgi:hypothetical protein
LGLEQCSCPCETEIPVCTAKQDLTGIADINYNDPDRRPTALNSASAIILYREVYVQKYMSLFILEIPITAVFLIQCIIEKLLMGNPICKLGLCAWKVQIRLFALVASYFLPISRNLPWHQMATATGSIFTNI